MLETLSIADCQSALPLPMPDGPLPPGILGRLATQALIDEANLTPKPGLVDRNGNGAHHDLSLPLLVRSAHTLEPYFVRMAGCSHEQGIGIPLRERLGALGREAEQAMLRATAGVNTHRGAIWALGLLVAAASQSSTTDALAITRTAARLAVLPDAHAPQLPSNGSQVALTYGNGGARAEAQAGFPHVRAGLCALQNARAAKLAESHARINALLTVMTTLEDTCILYRGGPIALAAVQQDAAEALRAGGLASTGGAEVLRKLHITMLTLWVSPGGSADILAATLLLDRICSAPGTNL